uniref:Protein kinase domain-containing protein n=1 Tax=Anguilla anguilla TaxID=7936 RepID=A0A0E9WWZ9_ANGAN
MRFLLIVVRMCTNLLKLCALLALQNLTKLMHNLSYKHHGVKAHNRLFCNNNNKRPYKILYANFSMIFHFRQMSTNIQTCTCNHCLNGMDIQAKTGFMSVL